MNRATAVQRIVHLLRERILSAEFAPGSPLREEELADTYGVSRHVIREVLRILASEGMADYASYRGARVPMLRPDDIEDIFLARQFLECGILQRNGSQANPGLMAEIHVRFTAAVQQSDWKLAYELDIEFHSAIVGLGGSPRLVKCHRELMHSLNLAHLVAPEFVGSGLVDSIPQHAEIIIALVAADPARAVTALEHHLNYAKCLLLNG